MKSLRVQSLIPVSLAAFLVLQVMVGASVRAQERKDSGWFFETGIGSARDRNEVVSGIDVGKTNYVTRAYLGYRFWKYLGIEAGVLDFKTIKYTNLAARTTDKFDFEGFHGKIFGSLPLSSDNDGFYALFVSGGGWRWDAMATSPSGSFHSHGTGKTGSAGMLFSGRSSALKLEYERFFLKPTVPAGDFVNDDNKLKYDVISVNFLFYM